MDIAIVGCGIGGLATASFLARAKHNVTIFERFEKPKPVGSGLVIQPVGQEVLKHLGLLDDVVSKGAKGFQMEGVEVKIKRRILDVSYGPVGGDNFGLGIHRASLFDPLLKCAVACGVNLQTSCDVTQSVIQGDKRVLKFANGAFSDEFDLIIDAAGVNSVLSPLKGTPLKYGAIWGTIDWPKNTDLHTDRLQQRYRRAHTMVGILPTGTLPNETQNKATLFWSMPVNAYDKWKNAPIEEWRAEVIQMWPELTPFISQITQHSQMTFAQYSHGSLQKPYQDKLVHIGDAAHRASPQLGQGANMALLDAFALSQALEKHPLGSALKQYHAARKRHTNLYQALSWAFTPMYQSDSIILPFFRDWIAAPFATKPPIAGILTHLVNGSLVNPCAGFPLYK